MAARKENGRGYSSADKFTWQKGDVQMYESVDAWKAAVAAKKKQASSSASAKKSGTTAKKKK